MLTLGDVEAVILWLAFWVGIPGAMIYVVRRFLRAYEARTAALARAQALAARLARLEAQAADTDAPHASASRAT